MFVIMVYLGSEMLEFLFRIYFVRLFYVDKELIVGDVEGEGEFIC